MKILVVPALLLAGFLCGGPLTVDAKKSTAPIVCSGNQDLHLNNISIKTRGVALLVKGNCTVHLSNSRLHSSNTAIKVIGNGDLTVKNSQVRGKVAVYVGGQGDVYGRNSRFRGRIIKRQNGDFHNAKIRWRFQPPKHYKRSKPIICKGSQDIRLKNRWIKTYGTGIVSKGSCDIVLTNCWIYAKGYALKATGAGDIKLNNCFIIGEKGAVYVGGAGDVTTRKSVFHGKIVTRGNGDFNKKGGNRFFKR